MGWVKDSKNWFEKTIQRNVGDPIQAAGKSIDRAIFKPIGEATGIRTTPIPESAKPKIDPSKAGAMAQYGQMVQGQADNFNPAAYGPNTFQARNYTPQVSSNTQNIPGIYSPAAATPTAPAQTAAPNMQNVSGQMVNPATMGVRDLTTGTGANTYSQQAALAQEMARLSNPTAMTAGYDPNMRRAYISNATAGLDKQKAEAMARLKEEQMKAGNYGSSVGQKAMADLESEFETKKTQAANQADLMQMEAEREDRYRNVGVDQSRTGLLTSVAGAGANMNLATQQYTRDTQAMQNSAQMAVNDFARQGIQIDNNTAMQLAEFAANQDQQGFVNKMTAAGMTNDQAQQAYNSMWQRYQAQTGEKQYSDTAQNQAKMFNIGQADTADVRNYGVYQDALRGLAAYGSDQIDPTSMMNYQMWLAKQQQKSQNAANAINAIGAFL